LAEGRGKAEEERRLQNNTIPMFFVVVCTREGWREGKFSRKSDEKLPAEKKA